MIDHTYEHFRRKTETDTAAAILTLASVLQGQHRMLTVKEAADVLKCSTDAIYQMVEAKTLAHKRLGKGGHIRIPESALLT
jgi:excisionase family DNA binding protein